MIFFLEFFSIFDFYCKLVPKKKKLTIGEKTPDETCRLSPCAPGPARLLGVEFFNPAHICLGRFRNAPHALANS
jgi:hypothetical protein